MFYRSSSRLCLTSGIDSSVLGKLPERILLGVSRSCKSTYPSEAAASSDSDGFRARKAVFRAAESRDTDGGIANPDNPLAMELSRELGNDWDTPSSVPPWRGMPWSTIFFQLRPRLPGTEIGSDANSSCSVSGAPGILVLSEPFLHSTGCRSLEQC